MRNNLSGTAPGAAPFPNDFPADFPAETRAAFPVEYAAGSRSASPAEFPAAYSTESAGALSGPAFSRWQPTEIWRDIPGYEGSYQASSRGRIRSLPRYVPVYSNTRQVLFSRLCGGKILRPSVCDRAGHVSVHLGKHCRGIPVHQLVIRTFFGPPPAGMEVMHLNGIPTDNRPENLRYGTHSENMIDMCRKGKGALKLTPEQVLQIRSSLSGGLSCRELARRYNVSTACIRHIKKGRRYAWVG